LHSEHLLLDSNRWFTITLAVIAGYFECSGASYSALSFCIGFEYQCFSHYVLAIRFRTTRTLRFVKLTVTFCWLLTFPYVSETTKNSLILLFNIDLLLVALSNQMSINDEISLCSCNWIIYDLVCSVFIGRHFLYCFVSTFRCSSTFKIVLLIPNYTLASIASIYVFAPQYQVIWRTQWLIPRRQSLFVLTLPRLLGLLSWWPYLFILLL